MLPENLLLELAVLLLAGLLGSFLIKFVKLPDVTGYLILGLLVGPDELGDLVAQLRSWYTSTELPIYQPGDAAKGVKGELPQSASQSVLCHISVSKWCYANKIEATSKKRNERCGRLTADVAGKAAEIFNAKIDQGKNFKGALAKQEAVETCGACHQTKGNEANWAKGVMDCTPCHNGSEALANKFKDHP